MSNRFAWLIISLAMVPSLAQASTATERQFRSASVEIPATLRAAGINEIGALNLGSLIARARVVPLQIVTLVSTPGDLADSTRRSAHWQRSSNDKSKITVSSQFWSGTPPEAKPALALHELLGASGFDDAHYNLSTAMWLLQQNSHQPFLNSEDQTSILNYLRDHSAMIGGVTGVGGGGDMGSAEMKIQIMKQFIRKLRGDTDAQIHSQDVADIPTYLDMDLEFNWVRRPQN